MQVMSGDSYRMREIEGVGTKEPMCGAELLRMGGQSFQLPVWCGDLLELGLQK